MASVYTVNAILNFNSNLMSSNIAFIFFQVITVQSPLVHELTGRVLINNILVLYTKPLVGKCLGVEQGLGLKCMQMGTIFFSLWPENFSAARPPIKDS